MLISPERKQLETHFHFWLVPYTKRDKPVQNGTVENVPQIVTVPPKTGHLATLHTAGIDNVNACLTLAKLALSTAAAVSDATWD